MKPIYARKFALALIVVGLALGSGPEWMAPATAGQEVEKRWIVLFHQQGALPSDAEAIVTGAGGSVLARLPEVGALVARSSDVNFAADASNQGSYAVQQGRPDVIVAVSAISSRCRLKSAASSGCLPPDTST